MLRRKARDMDRGVLSKITIDVAYVGALALMISN